MPKENCLIQSLHFQRKMGELASEQASKKDKENSVIRKIKDKIVSIDELLIPRGNLLQELPVIDFLELRLRY